MFLYHLKIPVPFFLSHLPNDGNKDGRQVVHTNSRAWGAFFHSSFAKKSSEREEEKKARRHCCTFIVALYYSGGLVAARVSFVFQISLP